MNKTISLLIILFVVFIGCTNNNNDSANRETEDNINENILTRDENNFLLIEGKNIWIRKTPVKGKVVMKLNTGDKCTILKKGEGQNIKGNIDFWYKIEFEGKKGWVFGSQTSVKTGNVETVEDKKAKLEKTFKEISALIKAGKTKKIKNYFYQKNKVILIDNPGAYTVSRFTNSLRDLDNFSDYFPNCKLKFEKWPEYQMEDQEEEWSKTGCYAEEIKGTDYFTKIFEATEETMLIKFTKNDYNSAKKFGQVSTIKIIVTECYLRFYFTYQNGKWLLTAVDTFDFSA